VLVTRNGVKKTKAQGDKEHGKQRLTTGISCTPVHFTGAQHCDTAAPRPARCARQHPKATTGRGEKRTEEKLSHGESGSRGRLPPGPRHGRHRRRARDPRGEGSEPGESSFSGSFL
jgi:hypothetical protein